MFFSDVGGKAERGTPYYIHTRVRQGEPKWMHQGNEEEIGGGGRWIHYSIIYKEIGTNIIYPTTSVCDHSSFQKEEI